MKSALVLGEKATCCLPAGGVDRRRPPPPPHPMWGGERWGRRLRPWQGAGPAARPRAMVRAGASLATLSGGGDSLRWPRTLLTGPD